MHVIIKIEKHNITSQYFVIWISDFKFVLYYFYYVNKKVPINQFKSHKIKSIPGN